MQKDQTSTTPKGRTDDGAKWSSTEACYGSSDWGSTISPNMGRRNGNTTSPEQARNEQGPSYATLKWLEQTAKQDPWNPYRVTEKGKTRQADSDSLANFMEDNKTEGKKN
ncbi:MAG: hypothetical protein Q9225_004990 [Loekoesia sp. 1 TL-2023]